MLISSFELHRRVLELKTRDKEFEILMNEHNDDFTSLIREDKDQYCNELGIEIFYPHEVFQNV